jgi:mitogen-activated protein kinase 1/3
MIFNVIGTPNQEDISFVTDNMACDYLNSFPFVPRMDLNMKFPGASAVAIDFLNKTLVLNPYFRISLEEAVNHPLFDNVRTS